MKEFIKGLIKLNNHRTPKKYNRCEECHYVVDDCCNIICSECGVFVGLSLIKDDYRKRGWLKKDIENDIKRIRKARKNAWKNNTQELTVVCVGKSRIIKFNNKDYTVSKTIKFYE